MALEILPPGRAAQIETDLRALIRRMSIGNPLWGASANAYKVFGTHNSIDYACGHCDTILMHADQDQIHNLVIHCTLCGSYNTTTPKHGGRAPRMRAAG